MILRLFRYRLHPGGREAFEATANGEDGFPRLATTPGLVFAYGGRSRDDERLGVVITAWETFEALGSVVGRDLTRPTFLPRTASRLISTREVTHWEALDLPPVGSGDPAVIRLLAASVDSAMGAAYYARLRADVWPVLARLGGVAGAWVGRQLDGGAVDPIVAVSLWRSLADAEAADHRARTMFEGPDASGLTLESAELFDLFSLVRAAVPAPA